MKRLISLLTFVSFCIQSFSQVPAFPGAEGFGKYSVGGRGCEVYHVTNLNDDGPGSFRDAVSRPHRTVVFDVGGVVVIKSKVHVASFITIAGQTAPGKGITIYGDGVTLRESNDVIIRHVRFRGSIDMGRGTCTLSADYARNIIFDHVSIEWGRWDNLHIKNSRDVTLQYCIIGEAIDPQRFGALLERPENLTVYNCLWVNNQSRNPKAKAGIEFVNNVIYNWGSNGFGGGHSAAHHHQDIINNYFIAGPNSSLSFISGFSETDHVWQKGNMLDMDKNGRLDGRLITDDDFAGKGATIKTAPSNSSLPLTMIATAEEAFHRVLKEAGASLKRDAVDKRQIKHAKSLGRKGQIIRSEAEAGGRRYYAVSAKSANKDSDGDGIPDRWERKHGLDPLDPSDGRTIIAGNGYTNLEIYLNELAKP